MNHQALSPLFALLIFVAHLNCVVEHGIERAFAPNRTVDASADIANDLSSPVESNSCEHDCICKGATLADHYVLATSDSPAFGLCFLEIDPAAFTGEGGDLTDAQSPQQPVGCWPLRALDRCAMLQTFLI